ncbi:MAG: hypothetical protein ACI8Z7_000829 [Candidatus Nanohaloarchaea archaeon]
MNRKEFLRRAESFQDSIVERIGGYSVDLVYYSFAFVFFYFGIQKPAPVVSPPRFPISSALTDIGIPVGIETVILVIGMYEVLLAMLFLFKKVKLAFWPFLIHQFTGFAVLILIPYEVFQAPWIEVAGLMFPWYLGSFSAFVLKNVVFVSAFLMLYHVEMERAGQES